MRVVGALVLPWIAAWGAEWRAIGLAPKDASDTRTARVRADSELQASWFDLDDSRYDTLA
jgi:hypothetical protein